MISSKEFASIVVTVITRVIDNAVTESLSAQPEYHTIMLSFESICEDMNLDQELERHCYQILLRMTADTKTSWWKKVDNVKSYIPDAVQKRYGKLIPTDITDVHSVQVHSEKVEYMKRSAALRSSSYLKNNSATIKGNTKVSSAATRANARATANAKVLAARRATIRSNKAVGQNSVLHVTQQQLRSQTVSSPPSYASHSSKFTLHSSPTIMNASYLNPQYSRYSNSYQYSQRNEEDDQEILQLAGVLNSQTPGRERRVKFNTDETTGLSVEDLEASTTRVDVKDSYSIEMGSLMNDHVNSHIGNNRISNNDSRKEEPEHSDRMTAEELSSPEIASTQGGKAPSSKPGAGGGIDRNSSGGGRSDDPDISLLSPVVKPLIPDRQSVDVTMSVRHFSSPEHVLLSTAKHSHECAESTTGCASVNNASTAAGATGPGNHNFDSPEQVLLSVASHHNNGSRASETRSHTDNSDYNANSSTVTNNNISPIRPRSVLSELNELMMVKIVNPSSPSAAKTNSVVDDFNIKSSVKLLFLFQKFLTSHCLVHHYDHDHPFEHVLATRTVPIAALSNGSSSSSSSSSVSLTPSATAQMFDSMIASKRELNVAQLDGLVKSPLGLAANPIGTRALFIWYDYFSSLNEFVSSLFGREQWLRSEMKSYVKAHLCRVIFKEWCYYSGVMVHAREHCDITLKRLGISRWVEFLYKRKQLRWSHRRKGDESSLQDPYNSRSRHFNVSPDRIQKLNKAERRPPRIPVVLHGSPRSRTTIVSASIDSSVGVGSKIHSPGSVSTASSGRAVRTPTGTGIASLGSTNPLYGSDSDSDNNSDKDSGDEGGGIHSRGGVDVEDELTSDRFAHLFVKSSTIKSSSSSLLHPSPSGESSQSFRFLNSLNQQYSTGAGRCTPFSGNQTFNAGASTTTASGFGSHTATCCLNREFIRRLWGRAGMLYSKEGWLFQLSAFRRLFKRTVMYYKSGIAIKICQKGGLRLMFANWKSALAAVNVINQAMDAKAQAASLKFFVHRKRRALRLLREHREQSIIQRVKDTKTISDLLKNPIARKAARMFQCSAYVKCFYNLKQYCAEHAPSKKIFELADNSHARFLCGQGFRQWRYYLEVSQRLLVEQQLKQLDRLRLFGLKSNNMLPDSMTASVFSASSSSSSSSSISHRHHLMEPLSSSAASISLSSKGHNYESEINKILHDTDSVTSNSALRRQHPLLWHQYNVMRSTIQSSYETPPHVHSTNITTGGSGVCGAGSFQGQNKKNMRVIRDYLILLTNRVGYLRAMRKLKKYSICPRLYFSPVDMLKSELNSNKNSLETRRASVSFREKGSCRYFNAHFERVQAQQIAMFRKEKYSRSSIGSSQSGKDVFSAVGFGIPAFEYTSCIVLSNTVRSDSSRGSGIGAFKMGIGIAPTNKRQQIASKHKQAKSFKLQIKSGKNVYSTMVTSENPYLQYLYENNKSGQHIGTDDILQSKQQMNSLFVRDAANGVIVTASSLYLVQFRRFVQNCRLKVSLRRRALAVRSYFTQKYHWHFWKMWRGAYLDLKRFRVVLATKCFQTLLGTLVRRKYITRLEKKANKAYMLLHWKRFKYTVRAWIANRLHTKQKCVRVLCTATYSKTSTPVVAPLEEINPLTGEPVPRRQVVQVLCGQHRQRTKMVSIKRLFPATKEKSELFRRLNHYLSVCDTRGSVLRRFHCWADYAERKTFGNRVVAGVEARKLSQVLHKLRKCARRQIAVRTLRHKVYTRCMNQWRVQTLVRITFTRRIKRIWHAWRLHYLKNLAGRVWFRPIYERQKHGWDRWVNAVKAVNRIETEVVEHLRLSRMHRVLYQWLCWRKALVQHRIRWRHNILMKFRTFAHNSKMCSKLAELRGSFHYLCYKFHLRRMMMDTALKVSRRALQHLVAKHKLSMSHLHGLNTPRNLNKHKQKVHHDNHMNRFKTSKLLIEQRVQRVTDTVLLKHAFKCFKKFDNNAVRFAEKRYAGDQHCTIRRLRQVFTSLQWNITRGQRRREKQKRDAVTMWKHRHLLHIRMCQFEDVAMDYHCARRIKLCLRFWREKLQNKKNSIKLIKDSIRYHKNRIVGIALLYIRSVASLTRKKEKQHAQQEWLAACAKETMLK